MVGHAQLADGIAGQGSQAAKRVVIVLVGAFLFRLRPGLLKHGLLLVELALLDLQPAQRLFRPLVFLL